MSAVWSRFRWPARVAIYALIGLLTFPLQPPGATALPVQFAAFVVAGVALLTVWTVEQRPAAARRRGRVLPVALCIMGAAGGLAATAGFNENNCAITLASLAATGSRFDDVSRTILMP